MMEHPMPTSPKCHTVAAGGRQPRTRMYRTGGRRRLSVRKSLVIRQKSNIQEQMKRAPSIDESEPTPSLSSSGRNANAMLRAGNLRQMLTQKCDESRRLLAGQSFTIDPSTFSLEEQAASESGISFRATNKLPRSSLVDLGLYDVEEQRKQLEMFEQISRDSFNESSEEDGPAASIEEKEKLEEDDGEIPPGFLVDEEDAAFIADEDEIEVAPGVRLALVKSEATWHAILEGRIIVTKCSCCQSELTCIDHANIVVCSDCWVFSPVDQNIASLCMDPEAKPESRSSVGIGIKADDIFQWLNSK